MILTLYTDGAARGNPGPGGLGVVIQAGVKTWQFKKYLGETTNNKAEYCAMLFALEKARELISTHHLEVERIVCYSDSELMVCQLTGEYKVKDVELGVLFVKVWNASQRLPKIEYRHIPRSQNKEADSLANEAIDQTPLV